MPNRITAGLCEVKEGKGSKYLLGGGCERASQNISRHRLEPTEKGRLCGAIDPGGALALRLPKYKSKQRVRASDVEKIYQICLHIPKVPGLSTAMAAFQPGCCRSFALEARVFPEECPSADRNDNSNRVCIRQSPEWTINSTRS